MFESDITIPTSPPPSNFNPTPIQISNIPIPNYPIQTQTISSPIPTTPLKKQRTEEPTTPPRNEELSQNFPNKKSPSIENSQKTPNKKTPSPSKLKFKRKDDDVIMMSPLSPSREEALQYQFSYKSPTSSQIYSFIKQKNPKSQVTMETAKEENDSVTSNEPIKVIETPEKHQKAEKRAKKETKEIPKSNQKGKFLEISS